MGKSNTDHFSLHRFNEQVALGSHDIVQTLYLKPDTARSLARLLLLYADDCDSIKFTDSQIGSWEVTAAGTKIRGS